MTSPQRLRTARWFVWAPWFFLILAICLQIRAGFVLLPGDLAEADPPAHFTTGVMLYDFLFRPGHSLRPLAFAECFYIRYPKLELGHWPPVFYVVEALWFVAFGPGIAAARWLCASIAAGCGLLLYRRCQLHWGRWHAAAATAFFMALPIVRQETWRIMSDILLASFIFLAICSLSDYLTGGETRHALSLAAWTSLAILTKGTGWLLLIPIAAGPLVTGRRRVYSKWSYWLAILLLSAVAAPFFIWMSVLKLGYPLKMGGHLHRLAVILSGVGTGEAVACGLALSMFAAAIWRCRPREELNPRKTMCALCAFWGFTLAGFISLVPMTPELDRYFMAFLAAGVYLLAGAMATLERRWDSRLACYGQLFAVLSGAVVLALVPVRLVATTAFSRAIDAVPEGRNGRIILVDSDFSGEGAMIAARLDRDPDRSTYLLRGSRFLADSNPKGEEGALRYETPAALRAALESVQPDYAVVDTSAISTPGARLLSGVLNGAEPTWEARWEAVSRVPVLFQSRQGERRGELIVYRRQSKRLSDAKPYSALLGRDEGSKTLTCAEGSGQL